MRTVKEALAQEMAKKAAEEKDHQEALARTPADAAKKEPIKVARKKVAEERARTELS